MIRCEICEKEEESKRKRGGPSGLPEEWISCVGITKDPTDGVDSVDQNYSGTFCSYKCMLAWVQDRYSHNFYDRHSVRPAGLELKEEVTESREMQATRIGLTVLDILDVLSKSETDAGALIPLTQDYEDLPSTCVMTVAKVFEEDMPEAFQLKDPEVSDVF